MSSATLPVISPAVPLRIHDPAALECEAEVADWIIKTGVLEEHDLPTPPPDPINARPLLELGEGLRNWLLRQLGPMRFAKVRFSLGPGEASYDDGDQCYEFLELVWGEGEHHVWQASEALAAIEQSAPGLANMLLRALKQQGSWPVITPLDTVDLCSDHYWGGEADEIESIRSMAGDDEEEAASIREDMVTRADVDSAYPRYLTAPKSRPSKKRLRNLRRRSLHTPAGEVAATLLQVGYAQAAVRQQDRTGNAYEVCPGPGREEECQLYRHEHDSHFIGYGAILVWHERDVGHRVWDDQQMHAMSAGIDSYNMGTVRFQWHRAEDFAAWALSMKPHFRMIRLVDRLLWHATS